MLTVGEIKHKLKQANALHLEHQEASAIELLKEVLPYQSDNAHIYAAIGECYVNIREAVEGLPWLKKALALDNSLKACHIRIADAYNLMHKRVKALEYLKQCAGTFKGDPLECQWWLAKADVYKMMRFYERSEACYQEAFKRIDDKDKAWKAQLCGSYAGMLELQGRHDDATRYFELAYVTHPTYVLGSNLAMHYLTVGNWEWGWRLYEIRLQGNKVRGLGNKPCAGLEDRIEGPLYFYQEGGLGDLVQMARYIPLFKDVSPELVMVVDPRLMEVARMMKLGNVKIIDGDHTGEHEAELPMLSLPLRSDRLRPEDAPPPVKMKVKPIKRTFPNVLINWFGEKFFTHDDMRSMKLADFAPLVRQHPEINWFCVNIGERVGKEIASTKLPIMHYPGDLKTAIQRIAGCDAMVTTDTGLAHVAGTLGKPVLMVLGEYSDWRWELKGDHTAWYPSIKLYRCNGGAKMEDILTQIDEDLSKTLKDVKYEADNRRKKSNAKVRVRASGQESIPNA
ncbi:MAG: hypothetical protein B7X10_00395 [Burkholderiales bacterium 21-58-4]|nr:MAG: hypothetical protein B7X10_00395 [Burkholderiales bacterium 21-58-4]